MRKYEKKFEIIDLMERENSMIDASNMRTNSLYVKVKKAFCQRQGDLLVKASEYADDLEKL